MSAVLKYRISLTADEIATLVQLAKDAGNYRLHTKLEDSWLKVIGNKVTPAYALAGVGSGVAGSGVAITGGANAAIPDATYAAGLHYGYTIAEINKYREVTKRVAVFGRGGISAADYAQSLQLQLLENPRAFTEEQASALEMLSLAAAVQGDAEGAEFDPQQLLAAGFFTPAMTKEELLAGEDKLYIWLWNNYCSNTAMPLVPAFPTVTGINKFDL